MLVHLNAVCFKVNILGLATTMANGLVLGQNGRQYFGLPAGYLV